MDLSHLSNQVNNLSTDTLATVHMEASLVGQRTDLLNSKFALWPGEVFYVRTKGWGRIFRYAVAGLALSSMAVIMQMKIVLLSTWG